MNALQLWMPKNQNHTQRIGFATALIAMVLVVFLHNPVEGYKTEEEKTRNERVFSSECTEGEVLEADRLRSMFNFPIENWMLNFDPLPEGIKSWPHEKQYEWKVQFQVRATEIYNRCQVRIVGHPYSEPMPISEWRSQSPLIDWLGSVVNLLQALFATALAAAIWLFVFQSKSNQSRPSKAAE